VPIDASSDSFKTARSAPQTRLMNIHELFPYLRVRDAGRAIYGERSGTVRDPFGHEWLLGHSIEDVTLEEMQRRYDALMKQ